MHDATMSNTLQPGQRDVLSAQASRRAPVSNSNGRWRVNALGQLIDSSSADYLVDEISKLQIVSEESNGQMRTPPQSKAAVGAVMTLHETSPLETASETSVESNSPIEHPISYSSHSRESSVDTTGSALSQTLRAGPYTPLKVSTAGESRNRPHSYSGGLSAADLSRLQQAGGSPGAESWSSPNGTPEKQSQADQPTYPSLSGQNGYASRSQELLSQPQMMSSAQGSHDDLQAEYQQRRLSNSMVGQGPGTTPQYATTHNRAGGQAYRSSRGYNPSAQAPPVVPSPTNFAYPTPMQPAPLSLNNNQQQLYDMMIPTPPLDNPVMARLQQQAYRGGHQHSASDPASLRDPATLALINSSMQAAFANQMYPGAMAPPALFPNQFYGAPQDAYGPELAMMARLQAQYNSVYAVPLPSGGAVPLGGAAANGSVSSSGGTGNGPSATNRKLGLYKTELCRSWEEKGSCRYGSKCQFAHGEEELRKVQRHPKYKTEICRTFWVSGSCPYGKRCCFIHTELPANGVAPGADGAPPPPVVNPDGRARSASTNSDPTEGSTSLLARIKRGQDVPANSSTSTTPSSGPTRPGSLRVDTSVIDGTSGAKQNKSAFPSFTHNGILMPTTDDGPSMSPGPVTAAPDFGRHTAARIDIVGTQRLSKTPTGNPNLRHSFSGSDQLDFSSVTTPTASSNQYSLSPPEPLRGSRINGHVRSGSAGNWGAATRSSHLTAYPLSSIPGGESKVNSPWAEYNSGSRATEKNWV
ncbi:unnamed protein product [Somion occarium]|uniref:C3H1-type domain-containing protein n=1 Tax=Somion occarium TaxID=3059160 RepID=A0ABP1CP85_9APHY